MNDRRARWTGAILASLAVLSVASFLLHPEAEGGRPAPARKPAPVAVVVPEPEPPASVRAEAPVIRPEPSFPPPAERRAARDDGYREAREATWEGDLTGQVVTPEGPLANQAVLVEWPLALSPDAGEAARLKRAGARRDHDGAWWARVLAQTDDSGFFRVEGLPAVPLRVRVGSATQRAEVGDFAQIRTERP